MQDRRRGSGRRRWIPRTVSIAIVVGSLAVLAVSWFAADNAIHWTWKGVAPIGSLGLPAPENITFQSPDGLALKGWFFSGRERATVILTHGRGANRTSMLSHAGYLYREGFSVLLFDFRYFGESEGDASTFGAKEPLDIEGAVGYLKSRPDVDDGRLGVQGISLGAASAIMAAAGISAIRGVVAEIPFASVTHTIDHAFPHLVGLPVFPFAPLTKWIAEFRLGVDLDEVSPYRDIARISPRPIFLIDNGQDHLFRPDSVETLFQAAGEPKEYWSIEDAPHGKGWETDRQQYERRVVAFWRKAFGVGEHFSNANHP